MLPQKKRGGRPKKYTNPDDARRANIEGNRRRRQNKALQPSGPTNFIAFEPPLCPGVPTDTPETGLRTNPNIPIPYDNDVEPSEVVQCKALPSAGLRTPPPTQPLTSQEEAEITRQINQIQNDEQESNLERGEYDTKIAAILIEMQSANTTSGVDVRAGVVKSADDVETADNVAGVQAIKGSNAAGREEKMCDEVPLRSCFSQVASIYPHHKRRHKSLNCSSLVQSIPGLLPTSKNRFRPFLLLALLLATVQSPVESSNSDEGLSTFITNSK
ncbi:hypothetical protein B0J14DRAFT_669789 [Halenospora varia]|nr:hypothetical protein B0J14DRAFT_669789 [Halenospora varia]